MTNQDVFPKVSTDRVYDSEYNCINAGTAMGKPLSNISLENAMNITKLQYCYTVTDIPHNYLVVDAFTDSNGYNNTVCAANTTSTFCGTGIGGFYCGCNKKISTIPITLISPIKTIFFDKESYGTGSIVYNVLDASTGCCIACNLLPNSINFLTCCVCCHRYEIIQCADAISCIKSYAIAVGV